LRDRTPPPATQAAAPKSEAAPQAQRETAPEARPEAHPVQRPEPAPPVASASRPPPRSESRPYRPQETQPQGSGIAADGKRLFSSLAGGARDAARTVGSAAQNVLGTVKDKTVPAASVAAPPTLVSQSATYFPPEAASQGIRRGVVRARLAIDAAGNLTRVTILSADPPNYFEHEATRSLQRWRFNPGGDGRRYETELEFRR
jgi:TonB family protein